MKKILFPTDFSDTAINALDYAVDIVKRINGQLILVNAFDLDFLATNQSVDSFAMRNDESKAKLAERKEEIITKYGELDVDTFAAFGDAAESIQDVAKIKKADMIVMGTKGASGIKQFFTNSVTYDVIEDVPCPVMVIPEDATFSPIKKIMFATDYGSTTEKHIQFIRDFSLAYNSEVKIVHINTAVDKMQAADAAEGLKIDRVLGEEVAHSFEFVEDDNVLEGIGNYLSENEDVDMLIMVARERLDWFDSLSNPSATKSIVHHPYIPSLVIKA